MRINEHVALSTLKILLVPYNQQHVPTYHEWMKDPDIQAATASEPLPLNDEYAMQQSWRTDPDKLTFILCTPHLNPINSHNHTAEIDSMIGDVNLFISIHEEENGYLSLTGEVELMVATQNFQRKGYGRAALLTFLRYVMGHEGEIVGQFPDAESQTSKRGRFDYFMVKIKEDNVRSLVLFESAGFQRTEEVPNYFGEFELRNRGLDLAAVIEMMEKYQIEGYEERKHGVAS